jgi:hypothetical protein
MIDSLHLNIISCSCTCGNRWTHSYSYLAAQGHYLGGTPNPDQELKLPYKSFSSELRNFNGCFRCVPLALGEGWTKPIPESFKPRPKAGATADAIRRELLD